MAIKSWEEKLEDARAKKDLGRVKFCEKTGKTLALPSVNDVEGEIKTVPKGKVKTIDQMVSHFRAKYKSDMACPLLTGIHMWIISNAQNEKAEAGSRDILPWWRIIKSDGKLNPKYPEGPFKQKMLLEAEGIEIEPGRGQQPPRVKNLAKYQV